ncbi:biopolymer transporter ExbD [Sulfurimicrobium lacus]|uniref:Biopolymer transporter ExbD n=1 Tax=Sulfurimicrobium lacus TaxID=2715678 RepID=A0A6F8V692_9PROT|nr:biopolymer transporter ExbD [Sulfurimicrobium lacus]BCB25174.1 biopolymer transporter ExbD [Sulfurimicrobium lacus]
MAFGSFESGGVTQPMAEINTTPLVDVMLVLLVIFIITAPLFHQAVPIDLPRVDSTRLDDKPVVVNLALDSQGNLFLDSAPTSREGVHARLAEMAPSQPELHLRAERTTPYEKVADILAVAQRAGVMKIAFVTEPNR